jgi:asparagine synthase (glutamine-hydrolysing)
MCGINGIFAYRDETVALDWAELARTRDRMAARGPDGAGEWIADHRRVGLGHRRLSIIDLSVAAAQPMISGDGSFVVTFNGEIYNYRELRDQLVGLGRAFRSRSDTEVLLHLYAVKREAMVEDLRGMFAFAIWDGQRNTLFLARDPYGIKPLYYADDGRTFRFASQVKALLAGGAVSREPEPAGQVGFHLWGSVPEPFTMYQAIRALPAGTTLIVDRSGVREPRRYHSIAQVYCDAEAKALGRSPLGESEVAAKVRAAHLDSVSHHLVSDVPVGAFLSAGIDSGALVGLMRDAKHQSIQTVTVAFEEFRGTPEDEAPLAAEVARLYGTSHTTRVVTEAEFRSDLPRLLEAMDQPSIDGINTWFVSKAARELGLKVAISGLGGDELFRGYPSFRDIPRWVRLLSVPASLPFLGRAARIVGQKLTSALGVNPKLAGMVEHGGTYAGAYFLRRGLFMPWELAQFLDSEVVAEGLRRLAPLRRVDAALDPGLLSPSAKVATLESTLYLRNQLLRDTDWASMAHGLEIRVPLVDRVLLRRVAEVAARLATNGACALKAHVGQSPSVALPIAIVQRRKTGFATPVGQWLGGLVASPATNLGRLKRRRGLASRAWSRVLLSRVAT